MNYQCMSCNEVFASEEAGVIVDHVDDVHDRGLLRVEYTSCPKCGSDHIEEENLNA